MTSNPIEQGTRVAVRHEQGIEVGTVLGRNQDPLAGWFYRVEFGDRTQSTWPASQVSPLPDQCPTCPKPSGNGFGGSCDACETKRQARTERARQILRQHGQQDTEFGRAIGA